MATMDNTNVLLLSQIAGYLVGFILSLCTIIPLHIHQGEFKGHCLLFSTGRWLEEDGKLDVDWASNAYCNFVAIVAVLCLIVCLVQIYRLSVMMYKGLDSSFLSAFVEAVVCGILCLVCVASALMVTLGFIAWCDVIILRFPSCEAAAGQDIDSEGKISTNGFYIEMGTVQFATWGSFATWVGLAVFSTLKLCRYHQLENIRVSMLRERQRLVNEPPSPAPHGSSTPPMLANLD